MKLKTAIKTIYGEVNIFDESVETLYSIRSFSNLGFSIKGAENEEDRKYIETEITKLLDRQVDEICVNVNNEINIYLKRECR